MGVTNEGNPMSDENKNKAGLLDIRAMGLFYFANGLDIEGVSYESI